MVPVRVVVVEHLFENVAGGFGEVVERLFEEILDLEQAFCAIWHERVFVAPTEQAGVADAAASNDLIRRCCPNPMSHPQWRLDPWPQ